MTWDRINSYYVCIERLRSQELLWQIRTSCFSNYKEQTRSKIEYELNKAAYPDRVKKITTEDLERMFANGTK